MWTELFMMNREALSFEIETLIENLKSYDAALRAGDREELFRLLKEGNDLKEWSIDREGAAASGEVSASSSSAVQQRVSPSASTHRSIPAVSPVRAVSGSDSRTERTGESRSPGARAADRDSRGRTV